MKVVVCGRWNRHCSSREETRKLHLARNRYDAGRATLEELAAEQDSVTALVLRQLEATGADILGDGMIRWDSVFDVVRKINGCSGFEQLTRIPKTNHFHRQPVVNLPLGRERSILVGDFYFTRQLAKPIAMCLPGPYSLARQTQNMGDIGFEKLAHAYADVLNNEIRDLLFAGVSLVRIEDPQILDCPSDFGLFKNLSAQLLDGLDNARVALATWFGEISSLPNYFDLPFGIFQVDFIEGKNSVDALRDFPPEKVLIAGIVNARHTYRESLSELRDLVSRILSHITPDRVFLSAHTDFHFLPWEEAILKTKKLVRFAHEYA